jgi:hypothetical protein
MEKLNKTLLIWAVLGILLIGEIFVLYHGNKPTAPVVGADGKINGNYSIADVMVLKKPYQCTFEKTDGASNVVGTVYTDGSQIYGEFKIKTDSIKNEFTDFLIIKGGESYTWTSIQQNIGYKYPTAKSANKNASPEEQAQIVGTQDKILYSCQPWNEGNNSIFETPATVTFSELKI